jgi:hypothetical protein
LTDENIEILSDMMLPAYRQYVIDKMLKWIIIMT